MPKWTDKPWERQQGESEKAYEAFSVYRGMDEKRTFQSVADKLHKSCTLIRRWKEKWNWQERARAYDNELDREAYRKAVKDRKDMVERHIKIAMQMQGKALEALNNLSVEEMTAKDIKEYIKMATELERLSRTFTETSIEGKNGGQTQLADTIVAAYQKRKEKEDNGNA